MTSALHTRFNVPNLSPLAAILKGSSLLFSVCEEGSSTEPDDMAVDTRLGESGHLNCVI